MARTKYADKLADLERRVTKLEQDVLWIKAQLAEQDKKQFGFLDAPPMTPAQEKLQDEMDAAGRAYRESFRPKAAKPTKKKRESKSPLAGVVLGTFSDDSDFDKAMELGRKYREAQRPKPAKKKAVKKTQPVKRRA